MILRIYELILPYLKPRYQAIAMKAEVAERRMVIHRAPMVAPDAATWLVV